MSGDKEVARFTALAQRENEAGVPWALLARQQPMPLRAPADSPPAVFPFHGGDLGYADLVETRLARGAFFKGPSAVRFRLRHPLLEGEAPSPYQRVAVAADSGNGISAALAESALFDAAGLVGRATQSLAIRRRD